VWTFGAVSTTAYAIAAKGDVLEVLKMNNEILQRRLEKHLLRVHVFRLREESFRNRWLLVFEA